MAFIAPDGLHVDDADGVRLIRFDRPKARNAFNQVVWLGLADALTDAAADDSLRCVVLTGTDPAFTAGQDLKEMSDPSVFVDQVPGYQVLMPVVESFPKPLLAAVNGVAVGIGLTLLAHCDLVLISDAATLRAPFISLGVTTEASASVLLPERMGAQRAAEVLFCEPWLTPDDAVADGLALRVVPHAELLDQTMALARHIGGLPLAPVVATKRLLLAGKADAIAAARQRELDMFEILVGDMMAEGRMPGT